MLTLDLDGEAVYALRFSADGQLLLAGGKGGRVRLWDDGYQSFDLLSPGSDAIHGIDLHPLGRSALIATSGGPRMISLDTPGTTSPIGPPTPRSTTAGQWITGDLVAIGFGQRIKAEAGALELWDLSTSTRKEPRFPAPQGIRTLTALPYKKWLAWSEWGDKVQSGPRITLWEFASPTTTRIPLTQLATCLSFHPGGSILALGSEWTVRLIDLDRRAERAVMKGHKGQVTGVAFHPEGNLVLSGSWDGSVRIWDPAAERELQRFEWPYGKVLSVAYSPDGLRAAAGTDRGTVVVWDLD